MKKSVFILLLLYLFFSAALTAQSLVLTSEKNSYQAGNDLMKQQVEYRDPGSVGKNLNWDFRHLQPIDEDYVLRYFIPDSARMNRICGAEHRTRYYYNQENDTLWATGYENYTTYMKYIQPELRMKFPFTYGDTLLSIFEGNGEYSRRLKLHVKGTTRVHADAEGELLLPGSETIRKALRVHTSRHYSETGKDSTEMQLDTYSWYAEGMRYPVFESVKTTVLKPQQGENTALKDTVVFTTSFYYPPIEQRMQLPDEEKTIEESPLDGIEAVFTEADLLPNPVVDMLHISYKLTRDARISFAIYNNSGLCMQQTPALDKQEGYNTTSINMNGYMTGIYTLYVHVDDMVMVKNVIKK